MVKSSHGKTIGRSLLLNFYRRLAGRPCRGACSLRCRLCMAYDLLEHQGIDIRNQTLERRRQNLANLVGSLAARRSRRSASLRLSPVVEQADWSGVTTAVDNQPDCPRRGIDA